VVYFYLFTHHFFGWLRKQFEQFEQFEQSGAAAAGATGSRKS
jgi:hypothetical protein